MPENAPRLGTLTELLDSLAICTPQRRLLRSEADLDARVADVRKAVLEKLGDGPVQI